MRRLWLLGGLVALVLVLAACGGSDSAEKVNRSGPPVPEATFDTFEGETTSFAAYSGQPLVVNFWASWCPSCVAEMSAALAPAQREFGDRVTFIGMNLQDDLGTARRLVADTGVEWVNGVDEEGSLYLEMGGIGMPFTVFVSAEGEILEQHNGPLTLDQLNEFIESLLFG